MADKGDVSGKPMFCENWAFLVRFLCKNGYESAHNAKFLPILPILADFS